MRIAVFATSHNAPSAKPVGIDNGGLQVKLGVSLEEARLLIKKRCHPLPVEDVSIVEAWGRVCGSDVNADTDLPAGPQSAVDGYAVRDSGDHDKGIYTLQDSFLLGDHPSVGLKPGHACRVNTGGDLPPGTAAVFPQERTTIKDGRLVAQEPFKAGNNIKAAGEDFQAGEHLVKRGTRLTPGAISLLAAFGRSQVPVYRQPRVALASISRSIIPWHMQPEPGQTRDCNIPMLTALVAQNGSRVTASGIFNDIDSPAPDAFSDLLAEADVLIMIGGTFAATGHEAPLLMERMGAELLYWDVPVQPGSHTGAAALGSKLLLALSGNPAACAVGFQIFAAPALRALQGLRPEPVYVKACCPNGHPKKTGSRRFIRGRAEWKDGWKVTVLPGQKPSMIRSLVDCNALIDMPAGSPGIEAGQEVDVLLLSPQDYIQ